MSCKACFETEEIDGDIPDCRTDKGCLIPPLDEQGQRIFEIRAKLLSLREIVDAGTILKMYDATIEDIEMLSVVESELKELRDEKDKGDDNNAV